VADARECYYLDGARNQLGPVPADEIARLIRSGTIRRDTMIWYAGMPDWRPAGQVSEFASLFGQPATARPSVSPAGAPPMQRMTPSAGAYQGQARAGQQHFAAAAPAPVVAGDGTPTDCLNPQFGVWGLFWRLLVIGLCGIFIIPLPWLYTMFYRYIVESTWLPSGRRLTFAGKPGDIWYVFIGIPLSFLLVLIPFAGILALPFLLCYLNLLILRWFCAKVGTEDGTLKLEFNGGYWGLFGWTVLLGLSAITIIGPAWVFKFFMQWMCRNVNGTVNFDFIGTGWGILWRYFLVSLASAFLIPIPWVMRWFYAWIIGQIRASDLAHHFD
jgi:hypothetical protein